MPKGYLKIKRSLRKKNKKLSEKEVEEHAAKIWNKGKRDRRTVGRGRR